MSKKRFTHRTVKGQKRSRIKIWIRIRHYAYSVLLTVDDDYLNRQSEAWFTPAQARRIGEGLLNAASDIERLR